MSAATETVTTETSGEEQAAKDEGQPLSTDVGFDDISPESAMSELDIESLFQGRTAKPATEETSTGEQDTQQAEQPQQTEEVPQWLQKAPQAQGPENMPPAGQMQPQQPQPAQPQAAQPTELAALQAQMAQLMQQNAQLQQQLLQRQTQPAEQPTQAAQPGELPKELQGQAGQYNFTIPRQIIDGIRSEDDSVVSQTLQYMFQEVLNQVDQSIMQRVHSYVPTVAQNQITQHTAGQQQAERIREDFFGAFPEFRNQPDLRPMIQSTAQTVMNELGTTQWSEPVRNMVGARLRALFPHLAQGAPGAYPGQPPVPQVSVPGQQAPYGAYTPAAPYPAAGNLPAGQVQQPAPQFAQGVRAGVQSPGHLSEHQMVSDVVFGASGGGF